MTRGALAIAAVALVVAVGAAQQGRDSTAAPVSGTAGVTGTVVSDDQTNAPLRRAIVTITGGDTNVTRATVTDDQGRFTFRALPAGRYNLSAAKAAWLRTFYGSKHPGRSPFGLPPLELTSGATTTVVLRVLHGSAVSGTIVDQSGRPAEAIVRVMSYRLVNGVKTLTPAVIDRNSVETDDRGMYRLFGIPPGSYVIQATSTNYFDTGPLHLATPGDAQRAQSGTPGLFADQGAASSFAPVYFPGTPDVTAATVVTIGPNDERPSTDFALQLVPSAKVSGRVTAPGGAPLQRLTVRLVPRDAPTEPDSGFGMDSMNTVARTTADGAFAIASVPPGAYTLIARASDVPVDPAATGRGAQGARGFVSVNGPVGPVALNLWAMADVTVDGHEVANLDVRLQRGLHVKGRVVFEGAAAAPDPTRLRISLQPASDRGAGVTAGFGAASAVDASGIFDIGDVVPGLYRLAALPGPNAGGWTAASAMIGARDALDVPVEMGLNDDLSKVVVRFTDHTGEISGSLIDAAGAAGKPAATYFVVVFSADRSLWGLAGRRIKTPVQTDQTGRFRVTDLPPGEYFIAVATDIEPDDMLDTTALAALAANASKLTLADGEKKVQDFRIGGH